MSMMDWVRRLLGLNRDDGADRRRHVRYSVPVMLDIVHDGAVLSRQLDNVSVGGARVVPAIQAEVGAPIAVRDPSSEMSLGGVVVGHDPDATRIQFESEEAGIVVSTWIRVAAEGNARNAD